MYRGHGGPRKNAALCTAANFSKCAPLDCNNNLFKVYNILASFSDLPNRPIQYSIYVENCILTCSRSQETSQLSSVAILAISPRFRSFYGVLYAEMYARNWV